NALDDPAIEGIVINSRDISERKLAEENIAKLNRLYATLSGINTAIVHAASPADLYDRVCEVAITHGRFSMAWIGTVDRANQMMTVVAQRNLSPEDMVAIQDSVGRIAEGRGRTATSIRESRAIYTNDHQVERDSTPWHVEAVKRGIHGSATLPIKQGGEIVGVLKLYVRERDFFDPEQLTLLEEMRTDISFALDRFDTEAKRTQAEAALREGEERYRQLFHANPHPMFVYDLETLAFLAVNDAMVAHYGYTRDEFQAMTIADIRPPEEVPHLLEEVARQESRGIGNTASWRHRKKDGTLIEVEINTHMLDFGGRRAKVVLAHDVTESKKAQAELRAAEEQFRALVEQSIAGIYIIQDGRLAYVNPRFAETLGYGSADELIGCDASSLVTENERAAVAENVRRWLKGGTRNISYSTTALRKDGSTVEISVHGSRADYRGRPAIIGMVQDISERKRAEEQIQRHIEQLRTAFMSTVEVATTLSEMRDPYTAGHERRVGAIAVAIGAELGFDEQRIEGLRVAGFLHDIGKITIPSEILSKPGKLSPIEFQLIQRHAQASYDVLKDVKFPWPVAEVALQHHERMDGSGYPQGLKGEAILLEARIAAVADVVEAMSSHRPYRAGLGIDKALAEIERGRGSVYDPVVADACLKMFREKGYAIPA
ncbi:MAG: PAS domain S-box protein, partial [Pseudomonadota bacterium]